MDSLWEPQAAEQLVEKIELPKLSMRQFQEYCIDIVDHRLWDRLHDEEIVEWLQERARLYRKTVADDQFFQLIEARRAAHERSGIELPLPEDHGTCHEEKCLVPRRDSNHAGWFPRGTVSLIAGSSGAGKTVLLTHLLEDIRQGRSVQDHPPLAGEYRLLLVDRSKADLAESVEGKEISAADVLSRATEIDYRDGLPHKILPRLIRQWRREGPVDGVIIEGLDFWQRKINDFEAVYDCVSKLAEVARAFNVAIIGTVGSPKMKSREKYTLTRDNVLGSSAWPRVCSTVIFVQRMEGCEVRQCTILTRTGRDEEIFLSFEDGRAVFSDVPPSEGLNRLNSQAARRIRESILETEPGEEVSLRALSGDSTTKREVAQELADRGFLEKTPTGRWRRTGL